MLKRYPVTATPKQSNSRGLIMETSIALTSSTYWQRLAKKQLLNVLKKIDDVGINLSDPEGSYFFGNKQASLQADINVNDLSFYTRIIMGGSIAAGETWSEGLWQSSNLCNVIRAFARCEKTLDELEKKTAWLSFPLTKIRQFLSRNSLSGSRSNISAHYDLGNDMYQVFLDPLMQYSSAIFAKPGDSLEQAQINKLNTICETLQLTDKDHLLEIGTGWGGLAFYAAKHYGCKVTTTTISKEQFELAKQRIKDAQLEDKVTLVLKDYRELNGQYDKIVSIEMIEAVGHEYLSTYFKTISQLLKPNGQCLIQSITIADQRYDHYRKNIDFIQRYIFPGGCLPSISRITEQLAQHTDMTLTQLNNYGHHYAKTLQHWDKRFKTESTQLKQLGYDDYFQRLWEFYFAYCEGGFLEGGIDLVHIHASKPGARVCQA